MYRFLLQGDYYLKETISQDGTLTTLCRYFTTQLLMTIVYAFVVDMHTIFIDNVHQRT